MMNSTRSRSSLVREATTTIRRAVIADGAERTRLLRHAADLLVDLRGLFTGHDGAPDWRGKSYDYRSLVRDIYADAGLPADSADSTKTALRYHIGIALRERLNADDLDDAGLHALDPRERQQARREAPAPKADALIADIAHAARRLDEAPRNGVTAHDLARLDDAILRLARWRDERRR